MTPVAMQVGERLFLYINIMCTWLRRMVPIKAETYFPKFSQLKVHVAA